MTEVLEVVKKIKKEAERASPEIRVIKSLKIGQGIRQGDVYLVRIDDSVNTGAALKQKKLVPGEHQGSRHVVSENANLFEPKGTQKGISQTAILGPVVRSKERFSVTHPEHAHFSLPSGTYQCVQQLDARTQLAVRD